MARDMPLCVSVSFFHFAFRGTVSSEGAHWDLKLRVGDVHLTFPSDAVSEPTVIVVHRWNYSACSPPLQEHEAVVSSVIEISTNTNQPLEFNSEVKLALSHSALVDLLGNELVIKRLNDKESNEWEEVDGSEDIRCLSGRGTFFTWHNSFGQHKRQNCQT